MTRVPFAALLGAICAAAVGCSDPYAGREAVTGKVTLKGQPLKDGTIQFVPANGSGTQAVLFIVDGAYKAERKEGLLPGRYVIRISAADKKMGADESEAGGPGGSANITFFDLIPPEWNAASQHEVEVKSGAKNEFNFDVPNQAEPSKKKGKR
ncbi:MAG: hypothetical protein U0871_20890 [Gemmataceae bacterium]